MSDLIDFLRQRLDEDEAVARAATHGPWSSRDTTHCDSEVVRTEFPRTRRIAAIESGAVDYGRGDSRHIARHDPARVLREVEATRRIIQRLAKHLMDVDHDEGCGHTSKEILACDPDCTTVVPQMLEDLRILAAPYADHPDYRAEWDA